MLVGKTPFESEMSKMTFRRILKEQYVMPKYLSDEAQDLIGRILKVDVNQRITVEEVLEHPFLTQTDYMGESIKDKLETGNLITLNQKEDDLIDYINPDNLNDTESFHEDEPIKQEKDFDHMKFSPPQNSHVSHEVKNKSDSHDRVRDKDQLVKSDTSSKVHSGKTKKSQTKIKPSIKPSRSRSRSAKGSRSSNKTGKRKTSTRSDVEVIKEEENEDEESFMAAKLHNKSNKHTASNKNLMTKDKLLLKNNKENLAPNDYHYSTLKSDKQHFHPQKMKQKHESKPRRDLQPHNTESLI